MGKKWSVNLLNAFVMTGIVFFLLGLLATPLLLSAILKVSDIDYNATRGAMVTALTFCIYVCAIPLVIGLFSLRNISVLLAGSDIFSGRLPKVFIIIAICSFSEIVLYFLANIFLFLQYDFYLYAISIISVLVVTFLSLTIGLLSIVFADIFKQAAVIRDERDSLIAKDEIVETII